jgi:hypothetical protein
LGLWMGTNHSRICYKCSVACSCYTTGATNRGTSLESKALVGEWESRRVVRCPWVPVLKLIIVSFGRPIRGTKEVRHID